MKRLAKWEALPEGAILLTDREVLSKQYDRISNYQPQSQVWPFTYGLGMLGGLAALNGFLITTHYRRVFKLASYARLTTYAPTVLIPALTSALFHPLIVTHDILLGRLNCPLCIGTRSGSLQMALGGVYPLLLGAPLCIAQAKKHYTYAVPSLSQRKDLIQMMRTTAPVTTAIALLILANFVLGMVIASKEGETFLKHLVQREEWTKEELDKDGFE
ncbi:hypothetical protein ScPMuIL_018979 [Solemya velum]